MRRVLDAALAAGLFALGLALQLPIAGGGAFYMDEGFVLQTAAEINRGAVMYRDIVIPAPGPVSFYALAGLFRLVGDSFLASRVAIAILSSALGAILFLLARGATSRAVAVLAGLAFFTVRLWAFPHWHFFHYATCGAFLVAAAYLLLAWAVARSSLVLVGLAGLVAGTAVLTKQDVGGTGLIGLAAVVVVLGGVPRFGGLVALGLGALAVAVPTLAFFASERALGSLFDQTIRWTFRAFAEFDYLRLPAPWPLFARDPALRSHIGEYAPSLLVTFYWNRITASAPFRETAAWDAAIKVVYYLPFVLLALGVLLVAREWYRLPEAPAAGRRRARATLVVIYAAATLAAFNPPRDWLHLLVLYHPTVLVGALLLDRTARGLGRTGGRVVVGLAACAVVAALALDARILLDIRRTYDTPVTTAAGTVRLPRADASVVGDLLAYVAARTGPADPLPVVPYHPILQFFAGRRSGTSSSIFWPVRSPEATDARLIADFEAAHAGTVVYSVSQYAHLRRFRLSFPELFAWMVEHYEIDRTFTPPTPWGLVFCGLAPRRPGPPPVVDLRERLDDATVLGAAGRALYGDARDAVAGRTLWPFRRVVYQRPGVEAPTTIAFALRVSPAGARLRAGYGENPDEWVSFTPAAVTFSVTVAAGGAAPERVFNETMDPQRRPADREWRELAVDLSAFAGQEVVLGFHAVTDGPAGARADLAGWAEPVLE